MPLVEGQDNTLRLRQGRALAVAESLRAPQLELIDTVPDSKCQEHSAEEQLETDNGSVGEEACS